MKHATIKAIALHDLVGEISRDADAGIVNIGPTRWADASGKLSFFICVFKRRQIFESMWIEDHASDRAQFIEALSSMNPKLILHTSEAAMTTAVLRVMGRWHDNRDRNRIRLVRG
jgi:hypothetical protein